MNRRQLVLLLFVLLWGIARGQSGESFHWSMVRPPRIGVKTNLLWDATSTANLGIEVRLSRRYTVDLPVNYNAWSSDNTVKWKHFLVQPELRRWQCEGYFGHFFGLHGIYGHYNVGGLELPFDLFPELKEHRYQGDLYGAGLSYGYQWVLSPRWALEATLGAGYVKIDYEKFECGSCGKKIDEGSTDYFGPTKAGISLIFIIK
ncbi:MAG: DUF3575 domain-containing protein [Proteiniphilum sp.]|jgi:hypothetical protein|nr:DUF3575 domain-containing protein [Proteiniphilum sp.]